MELCFMKNNALDTLKNGLPQIFDKYLTQKDNSWLADVCGENPFVKFRDVPDFELAPLDAGFDVSKVDFNNSKILYKHLNFLKPRQAADERLWAGLCHGVFYDYVRRRWGYDKINTLCEVNKNKTIGYIKNRFFFNGSSHEKLVTNTLSKYWWAGHIFDGEALDILGANNFYTKIFSIATRTFIGNKNLRKGFVKFLKHFNDRGFVLDVGKHIRPAMIELNMTGGAVILDCLSEEEVAKIMIDHVERTLSQKNSRPIKSNPVVENIPAKKNPVVDVPKKSVDDTQNVKANDTITIVSLDNGEQRVYKISDELRKKINPALYTELYEALIGKTINSVVTIKDEKFKITDIK